MTRLNFMAVPVPNQLLPCHRRRLKLYADARAVLVVAGVFTERQDR